MEEFYNNFIFLNQHCLELRIGYTHKFYYTKNKIKVEIIQEMSTKLNIYNNSYIYSIDSNPLNNLERDVNKFINIFRRVQKLKE